MTNFPASTPLRPHHLRAVTRLFVWLLTLFVILTFFVTFCSAQTAVVISPWPQFVSYTQDGVPNAFGCVFTYQVASTTPLGTYTDYTGTTLNSNPVILSAGGTAEIWLQAGVAYTYKVMTAGGTNCSSGTTLYTVNGLGGGSTTLTTIVTYSTTPIFIVSAQSQLFELLLTGNASAQPLSFVGITPPSVIFFQITQDASGGHTFSWPANSVGGCTIGSAANQTTTQEFLYDGVNATAVGPCVIGNGPAIDTGAISATGNVTSTGQFISTVLSPTPPLVVASNVEVLNLNSNLLEGFDWDTPGTIGFTLPNTGVFTTLKANTSFILNGGTAQTATQGSDTSLLTSGTIGAGTALPLCTDANHGATTTCTGSGPNFPPQRTTTIVNATVSTQTIVLSESVTFPAAAGTYRADVRYGLWMTTGPNACAAEVIDTTNSRAFALSGQDSNGSGYVGLSASEVSSATYAAGAVATFTVQAQCNVSSTASANSGLFTFSPAAPTFLAVTPVLSN